MKFNQWTLGLAALGVVSLASAAKAEEKMSAVQAAMSSTTISGYVDTSMEWQPGTATGNNYYRFSENKSDGFNLNVIQLTIAKPLDEAEWAAGYRADLWFGPDANALSTSSSMWSDSDLAIRQAYVALRMPVGNGLDWKIGVFDSIIGYESIESGNNPNYTRSYGNTLEPTTHTGILATYRFGEWLSVAGGVANTLGPTINGRANPPMAESYKSYMASAALTAPDSWGFLKGSTLYFGVVNGFAQDMPYSSNGDTTQTSWYIGSTIATPVEGLKMGVALDILNSYETDYDPFNATGQDAWGLGIYASYQATEKLSFHARGELITRNDAWDSNQDNAQIWALTGTVQYDLWKNVISRLELRWDHGDEGEYFSAESSDGSMETRRNTYMLAANIIYKF